MVVFLIESCGKVHCEVYMLRSSSQRLNHCERRCGFFKVNDVYTNDGVVCYSSVAMDEVSTVNAGV